MLFEIKIPDIGSDELEVTEIFVKVDDIIKENQNLITIEGDKTSLEIPSTKSGIIKEIKVNIGDKIKTNSTIIILDDNIKKKTDNLINNKNKKNNESNEEIHASPLIRNLSRKFNIDLKKINGTGLKGRIIKEDIDLYIKKKEDQLNLNDNYIQKQQNLNEFNNTKKIKINNLQIISGKNLLKNWITIPHVTIFDKINITDLEIFRKKQNIILIKNKQNIKITPLVFIIKAVEIALNNMPKFNSSLSEDGKFLKLKNDINIGVAVETKRGLIVPVIKNIKYKKIIDIAKSLIKISKKAKNGFLNKNDIINGSFTISSLGHIGTTNFTPIINSPEIAILGVSKFNIEPIWYKKKFIPKLILPISLSFDHRVIDGADGARFINQIKYILSDIRNFIM
ncbi:MAG: CatA-like O-acetyltransferase [Enterobacteriaceae bacterium PC38]|nr:MAG: CatA-like O-acetyltransferase [Enterobacteriaceae bacterium PC38]